MLSTPISVATLPEASAGSVCHYGSYRYGAIGLPLPTVVNREGDRPGPKGNEVDQIYRVMSVMADGRAVLAGWLLQTFDGRYDFAAAELNITNENLGDFVLQVAMPSHTGRLPIRIWIRQLEMQTGKSWSAQLPSPRDHTLIAPCFAAPWDGKGS